jgi:hypothetical protein
VTGSGGGGESPPSDDRPKPYLRCSEKEWVQEVTGRDDFELCVNDEAVTMQGTCARCNHQIDDFVALDIGYAKRFARGKAEKVPVTTIDQRRRVQVPTVLACNCASEHAGRPEGALGCGCYGGLQVVLEQGPRQWTRSSRPTGPPRVKLIPDVARTAEKDWDRDAGEIEREQLAQVRGVAAKWSATVTAVLGVFGVAALVEGAEEIRKLDDAAATWVRVLGLTGAITALVAMGATAFATQGLPRKVKYVTGARLRLSARRKARSALWAVRVGAAATGASAVAVIAAIAVLVSADRTPPPANFLKIETNSGRSLCGKPRDAGPGLVAVEPAVGQSSDPVPLRKVRLVKPVTGC